MQDSDAGGLDWMHLDGGRCGRRKGGNAELSRYPVYLISRNIADDERAAVELLPGRIERLF